LEYWESFSAFIRRNKKKYSCKQYQNRSGPGRGFPQFHPNNFSEHAFALLAQNFLNTSLAISQTFYNEDTKRISMSSIIELPKIMGLLDSNEKTLFDRFFLVQSSSAKLMLPKDMKPWAEKTFGAIADVEDQKIIKVSNRFTYETALYNELRAKRPHIACPDDELEKELATSGDDPFCKPLSMTPADVFGRAKGKFCVSASNIAKYDSLHGVIIFKKHNPLEFSDKELNDYFKTALVWFRKANKSNKDAVYPYLLWNCLWRSGAGVTHGHMQVALGEGMHYGEAELYNRIRQDYSAKHSADYFSDLHTVHERIGLGMRWKGIKVFMNITPKKEKEITLISEKFDRKLFKAIYLAANCLVKDFCVQSFNLGVLLPPMAKIEGWRGFPVVARIVDRGKLSTKTCDIGGMEMHAKSSVIEGDPYKVFEKLSARF
jgi:hypothetical protein